MRSAVHSLAIVMTLLLAVPVSASVQQKAEGPSQAESLLKAAAEGRDTKVQRLLDAGVPVDAKSPNGFTALMVAADANRPKIVKELLDRGAQVNAALPPADGEFGGCTALLFAASGGGQAYIDSPLELAGMPAPPRGYRGHVLSFAVRHPDERPQWQQKWSHWAQGYDEIVLALIAHGADVNAASRQGVTPLIAASAVRSLAVVQVLVAAGADVNAQTHHVLGELSTSGSTALAGAVRQHDIAMVHLLLDHGAKVDVRPEGDQTPLGADADAGNVPIVKLLLNHGAPVNAYDDLGRTALMYAKRGGHRDVVALLTNAGARNLPRAPHAWMDLSEVQALRGKADKTQKGHSH